MATKPRSGAGYSKMKKAAAARQINESKVRRGRRPPKRGSESLFRPAGQINPPRARPK